MRGKFTLKYQPYFHFLEYLCHQVYRSHESAKILAP
jgi:hypothetical protein